MTDPATLPPRPSGNPEWRTEAACANDPHPDRWVSLPAVRIKGSNNPAYDTHKQELAAVCATCPVRDHCLWDAIDTDVTGIFAGTDEYDRADLRDIHRLPHPTGWGPVTATDQPEVPSTVSKRFTAHRYARDGYTNTEIAAVLQVSPMTISRLLAPDTDTPRKENS